MNPKYQDPKLRNTIRLSVVISNTPANQLLMATVIEQVEHIFQRAEGFAVVKCAAEDLRFMGSPNDSAKRLPSANGLADEEKKKLNSAAEEEQP